MGNCLDVGLIQKTLEANFDKRANGHAQIAWLTNSLRSVSWKAPIQEVVVYLEKSPSAKFFPGVYFVGACTNVDNKMYLHNGTVRLQQFNAHEGMIRLYSVAIPNAQLH